MKPTIKEEIEDKLVKKARHRILDMPNFSEKQRVLDLLDTLLWKKRKKRVDKVLTLSVSK